MAKQSQGRALIARNMRSLRKAKQWSQEDLAERCNMHRTYIGSIERCQQNVSIDNISKIAKAFRIKLHELLTPGFRL